MLPWHQEGCQQDLSNLLWGLSSQLFNFLITSVKPFPASAEAENDFYSLKDILVND